jgi:NAD(P)H-hydrate epimerase
VRVSGAVEARSLALPKLAPDAHKGDAGRVLGICGSARMPGAAILVARAAQRAGCGLYTAGCVDAALMSIIPAGAPEAVLADLTSLSDVPDAFAGGSHHCAVIGPGLGQTGRTRKTVEAALASDVALLALDADALNVLEGEPERLKARRAPLVITPHPGEARRLLGEEVPRDDPGRVASARELAALTGAIVCLKGKGTVVTDGARVYVNDTGNPGMATGGAGDVLCGILGAYLALCATGNHPHWTPFDAACAAVRAHGLAGDLAAAHLGQRALIASDLIQWLAAAQRRLEG